MPHSAAFRVSMVFSGVAIVCLLFADVAVVSLHPWQELGRLFSGLINPGFASIDSLADALAKTVAFAFLGVAAGSVAGFGLALVFHWRVVRVACAFVRAIHELFWALIFLQILGLHPLTGLLAIAVPYAGTFAKVYAEILEEGDTTPLRSLPFGVARITAFFYARLPDVWVHFKTYTLYRLECGLRSSAVLGFVGLPTLGYYLHSAFMQGYYSEVWALLILFYVLIATIRFWVRPRLLPIYLLAAPFFLGAGSEFSFANLVRFFTEDIVPYPVRAGGSMTDLTTWLWDLLANQALPGIINTVVLTQIALVATGLVALFLFPLISSKFFGRFGRTNGNALLVVLRSTPEYILAFILLQLWGPSMLPAIVALALHNGAIIGHLIGRYTESIPLRADSATGLDRYSYEMLPRVYGQFLAFLFYRWEIIMRESAILGILGVATLGFYIDSAIQEIRMDRAVVLIIVTALLNVSVDLVSRRLRRRMRLASSPACGV